MRIKDDSVFKTLLELGYMYSTLEGGYLAHNLATIVIDNREPYKGQVLQFIPNNDAHDRNVQELIELGLVIL